MPWCSERSQSRPVKQNFENIALFLQHFSCLWTATTNCTELQELTRKHTNYKVNKDCSILTDLCQSTGFHTEFYKEMLVWVDLFGLAFKINKKNNLVWFTFHRCVCADIICSRFRLGLEIVLYYWDLIIPNTTKKMSHKCKIYTLSIKPVICINIFYIFVIFTKSH